MAHSLVVTVDPTDEPVSLQEAKDVLRIDSSDDDAYVGTLIVAAREWCETYTKRHFVKRTVRAYWDNWPAGICIESPRPFTETTASPTLKYYAEGSTSATTLAASSYWVDSDGEPGRIVLRSGQTWPDTTLRTANAVELTLQTGYGSEPDVPDSIKQAILFLVGHWYANREAVLIGTISKEIEFGVRALLTPHASPFVA